MSYVNTDWLKVDELAEAIIETGEDLTNLLENVDDEINRLAIVNQLTVDDILVDGSGYVTSIVLKMYARYFALYLIMCYYAGSGNGNSVDDAYGGNIEKYKGLVAELATQITKETITGGTGDEVVPVEAFVEQKVFIL